MNDSDASKRRSGADIEVIEEVGSMSDDDDELHDDDDDPHFAVGKRSETPTSSQPLSRVSLVSGGLKQ
jgi:hypothetical protein